MNNTEKISFLTNLINFKGTIRFLSSNITNLDCDSDKELVVLKLFHIERVLSGFIAGKYSAADLEEWANLIECRGDIKFDDQNNELIDEIIYSLANPILEGKITKDSCNKLLQAIKLTGTKTINVVAKKSCPLI